MKRVSRFFSRALMGCYVLGIFAIVLLLSLHLTSVQALAGACSDTSQAALKSCQEGAASDYWLAIGKCDNVSSTDKQTCLTQAKADKQSALEDCKAQFDARQEICKELGGGPYLAGGIDPLQFSSDPEGNDYFPLSEATYRYKSFDQNGNVIEKDKVKVTGGTRTIIGVTCRAVRDTVTDPDGNVTEDTTDWYAQSINGDVWYFGEIAQQFITEDGKPILVGIEGSWTAGVEGAKPGIIMFAHPQNDVGRTYREEFALGDAEDVSKVIEVGLRLTDLPDLPNIPNKVKNQLPKGPYVHTQDFSALEPGVVEDKYYAKGVGLVLTIAPDGTEILVSITKP